MADDDQQPSAAMETVQTKINELIDEANIPPPDDKPRSTIKVAAQGQDLTNKVLHFLSTASNETLGACAVGLCASTYFVLGRLGLFIIGLAGGVILHATWEASSSASDTATVETGKRRKQLGIEVANRLLDWKDSRKEALVTEVNEKRTTKTPDFSGFNPETGSALTTLTDAVIRDYVKYDPCPLDHHGCLLISSRWWYGPVLPNEEEFPTASRKTLVNFILSFSNHVSRKRPADAFLDFLTNSSSIVIVFLDELSAALMTPKAANLSPADAIQEYLENDPESSLANVLSRKQQERKLALVANDILQNHLEAKAYNCEPVKVFLQQILAGVVLEMTISRCSKPEWINGWIVYLLEDGDSEFMEAIDAGVESMKDITKPVQDAAQRAEAENTVTGTGQDKRISRADQAMEEAMAEAKRLNEMIAAEEAQRQQQQQQEIQAASDMGESVSTLQTEGIVTPTSTDSDRNGNGSASMSSSAVMDITAGSHDTDSALSPQPLPHEAQSDFAPDHSPLIPASGHRPTQSTASQASATLTLHKASVSVFDDSKPGDKSTFKSKPMADYMLQIEPTSSRFPGWMISRKYTDFETLHEVLRRISVISGVSDFVEKHATLPTWKGQSKEYLRINLERYLQHALQFERLAESEGMKRFLEKETGIAAVPEYKNPFGFKGPAALENVGKGMLDVLGTANKGITGGGKAVLGGVQGVFGAVGAVGQKRPSSISSRSLTSNSVSSLPKFDFGEHTSYEGASPSRSTRESAKSTLSERPHRNGSVVSISSDAKVSSPLEDASLTESLNLPPPPSSIEDDYGVSTPAPHHHELPGQASDPVGSSLIEEPQTINSQEVTVPIAVTSSKPEKSPQTKSSSFPPLSEEETKVAVELFFAIINELYTLSSAWNIRLTLLNAAKTFLLRPGNPNLEAIRVLIQDSVITANFASDSGLAFHILKLRENALPTEQELRNWPPEPSTEEKEKLRVKARKLLVERGMPQALTSVMGAAASGEALGRLFDCLQVEEVARGLIFALLLQGIRAATQ